MKTTIHWRECPKEKPPADGCFTVLLKSMAIEECEYDRGKWHELGESGPDRMQGVYEITSGVTHFALPTDIHHEQDRPLSQGSAGTPGIHHDAGGTDEK